MSCTRFLNTLPCKRVQIFLLSEHQCSLVSQTFIPTRKKKKGLNYSHIDFWYPQWWFPLLYNQFFFKKNYAICDQNTDSKDKIQTCLFLLNLSFIFHFNFIFFFGFATQFCQSLWLSSSRDVKHQFPQRLVWKICLTFLAHCMLLASSMIHKTH